MPFSFRQGIQARGLLRGSGGRAREMTYVQNLRMNAGQTDYRIPRKQGSSQSRSSYSSPSSTNSKYKQEPYRQLTVSRSRLCAFAPAPRQVEMRLHQNASCQYSRGRNRITEEESGLAEEVAPRIDLNEHKEESSVGLRDLSLGRMVLARSRAA